MEGELKEQKGPHENKLHSGSLGKKRKYGRNRYQKKLYLLKGREKKSNN